MSTGGYSRDAADVTFPASGMLAVSCKFHGPLGMNGQLLTGGAGPGAR